MTCTEFERLIPDFLAQNMDYKTLKKFSEHMEQCEECHEEMVIQFLVAEGLQHLENGEAFDLQRELEIRLEQSRKKLQYHAIMFHSITVLEILAIFGGVAFAIWMLL